MEGPGCARILAAYKDYLIGGLSITAEGAECRLATPFFLPDNTQLTLGIVPQEDGRFEVTDFGETDSFLFLSGVPIDSDDERRLRIGRRFGVDVSMGEVRKFATQANLGETINDVIHAMLDLSYFVYTVQPRRAPTFQAEIEKALLVDAGLIYKKDASVRGKTNEHRFDFSFRYEQQAFLLDSISTTNPTKAKERAELVAYAANDVRSMFKSEFQFICVLDDRTIPARRALGANTINPLAEHNIRIVRWSDRQPVRQLLSAA